MTETEFTGILGPEWDVGQGKVDWFSYAEGKVSKEYAFPPPFAVVPHIYLPVMLTPYAKVLRSLLVLAAPIFTCCGRTT